MWHNTRIMATTIVQGCSAAAGCQVVCLRAVRVVAHAAWPWKDKSRGDCQPAAAAVCCCFSSNPSPLRDGVPAVPYSLLRCVLCRSVQCLLNTPGILLAAPLHAVCARLAVVYALHKAWGCGGNASVVAKSKKVLLTWRRLTVIGTQCAHVVCLMCSIQAAFRRQPALAGLIEANKPC